MSTDQQLGLDELMIVNPGPSGTQSLFLGDDGILYQLQDLAGVEGAGAGQFFLGEDGKLYQTGDFQIHSLAESGEAKASAPSAAESQTLGRYFLGEDGRLYERIS
ncbi:hypothetical protein [Methylomonas albis]|uniref:Cyclic nucleotide-binding domain-containing protein n=1 Tax=Methylomonas albis TaxID=1854563 RepID=A0ABR9D3C7_9GAMM|nr:hypothetical protein [Methylomonas albis]MBD9356768.1 hypothetical protein [Methylomonas albis]CAD6879918.1 hypothetical protein [Methylomonas albis]